MSIWRESFFGIVRAADIKNNILSWIKKSSIDGGKLEFKFMTSTVCYYVKTGHEQCFGNMSAWVVMKNETSIHLGNMWETILNDSSFWNFVGSNTKNIT